MALEARPINEWSLEPVLNENINPQQVQENIERLGNQLIQGENIDQRFALENLNIQRNMVQIMQRLQNDMGNLAEAGNREIRLLNENIDHLRVDRDREVQQLNEEMERLGEEHNEEMQRLNGDIDHLRVDRDREEQEVNEDINHLREAHNREVQRVNRNAEGLNEDVDRLRNINETLDNEVNILKDLKDQAADLQDYVGNVFILSGVVMGIGGGAAGIYYASPLTYLVPIACVASGSFGEYLKDQGPREREIDAYLENNNHLTRENTRALLIAIREFRRQHDPRMRRIREAMIIGYPNENRREIDQRIRIIQERVYRVYGRPRADVE